MRLLTLTEYRTKQGVALSAGERDTLRQVAPFIDITPTPGTSECYDLRPGSTIGTVDLGTLAIEIRPKLPIDRVLFLISYALGQRRWREIEFDLAPAPSLVEAIVPGFVSQLHRAFRHGVLQGYRSQEEALLTIRGRIRFEDQIRRRFDQMLPIEVRYDEFTTDIEENRLLRAAIERLRRLRLRSPGTRHALHAFDALLADVAPVSYDPRQLPTITWTRLNERYRPAVTLAKLILRATSFDMRHGHVRASTFLIDMNEVFEDFVVLALRDALNLRSTEFPQGNASHSLTLDRAKTLTLKPDISWWDGKHCLFVGDVKYKRTTIGQHDDIYQLLAYTVAADLPGGLLIYAAGEREPARHDIVHLGKHLEVIALDLAGPPEAVLRQIDHVAGRIRQLRQQALAHPLEHLALLS